MITLIHWEVNWSIMGKLFTPGSEESEDVRMTMLEGIKKDIDSGVLKMWGVSPAGGRGFMLFEGDEKALYAQLQKLFPRISFKVEPMLSIDETISTLKGMQQ